MCNIACWFESAGVDTDQVLPPLPSTAWPLRNKNMTRIQINHWRDWKPVTSEERQENMPKAGVNPYWLAGRRGQCVIVKRYIRDFTRKEIVLCVSAAAWKPSQVIGQKQHLPVWGSQSDASLPVRRRKRVVRLNSLLNTPLGVRNLANYRLPEDVRICTLEEPPAARQDKHTHTHT